MSGFELRFVLYIILTPLPFIYLFIFWWGCGGGRTLPSGRFRHPDTSHLGSRMYPSSTVVLELWRALAENSHSQHFLSQNPRGYALGI